jgi:hypothetical protein
MDKYSKVWKANHIKALESLGFKASQFNTLRAIENEANHNAVSYCNGWINGEEYEIRKQVTISRVADLQRGKLPAGFFVNSDPRGYALKINAGTDAGETPHPEYIPAGMHKDWGGYGILAPEF